MYFLLFIIQYILLVFKSIVKLEADVTVHLKIHSERADLAEFWDFAVERPRCLD